MFVLAQFSDTHLDGTERKADRTARVMDYLRVLPRPVDAVLVTGDIADQGEPAEYEQARALLTADVPVLACPGNHDRRAPFRSVLLGEAADDAPVNSVHTTGNAVYVLADSTVPGRSEGFLDDGTVAWLRETLAAAADEDGKPVFVCLHHPPVPLHSPVIDEIRLREEDRLARVIAGHPRVAAILCGHAHTPAASTFAGRPVLVAPGVASTLRLPWEPGELFDPALPPMLAFHVVGDDLRVTTHYRVVP
ncbi:calcineurin-like phosphoesterase family protein [Prauserella shujinwangii]|uniref:Calcineurin-like phosphoesterase family protein n=1 Tax=Prauserella shujinwangii TaxID=1453103 RepID=A0A2T0LKM8_9PSEU|nr:phosphodiesterase [Prauserella shujinwangii]PRX43466.1 calcineurin-like phosphoesterase family protein [Prauserella shujinwangii]